MPIKRCIIFLIVLLTDICYPSLHAGFYADITDELMVPPSSASMAGANLSIGNGVSVESTPGNLPFDSLNRLSLSYAGFYNNTFSTSIITYNGKPREDIGISLLAGYVYVPDIQNTNSSTTTSTGDIDEVRMTYFSASRMIFRAGAGRLFKITPSISVGTGVAFNAKRIRLPEIGYGISMDAGFKILFRNPGLSVAMQMENLTSSYTYWNRHFKERAYHHLRTGIGYEHFFPSLYGTLSICYASPDLFGNEGINSITYATTENDNKIETLEKYELYEKPTLLFSQGKYGLEYTFMNSVTFRLGLTQSSYTFGAGLHILQDRAGIDFAFMQINSLDGTYQLSINYKW